MYLGFEWWEAALLHYRCNNEVLKVVLIQNRRSLSDERWKEDNTNTLSHNLVQFRHVKHILMYRTPSFLTGPIRDFIQWLSPSVSWQHCSPESLLPARDTLCSPPSPGPGREPASTASASGSGPPTTQQAWTHSVNTHFGYALYEQIRQIF